MLTVSDKSLFLLFKSTPMKKWHIPIILCALLLLGQSCRKTNSISDDTSLMLSFSADTVLFDTVFTTLGSATHQLRIYNRNSDDLKISSIRLKNGQTSPFRVNLDGENATEFYDKIIPANDSLFSFLRVTIDPNDLNSPFVVEDELVFVTNGNTQTVKLLAWGQNAVYIVADKVVNIGGVPYPYHIVADSLDITTWTNERPYVIYGYALINSYGTLQIEEGTRIYCHQDGGIFSWSDGQLIINGTLENPVVIQGDRLEPYYNNTPGQWGQILLLDGRAGADHRVSHAIIRNGTIGLNCQSSLKETECSLLIDNTIIENQSGYGLFSIIYPVEAKNFVITNCGTANVWALGGQYRFFHGTIANYWDASEHKDNIAMSLHNYTTDAQGNVNASCRINMEMTNCIVYGGQKDEFQTQFVPDADTTFLCDHCLFKSEKFAGATAGFSHCLFNYEPFFADYRNNDLHIADIASPVIGTGNPLIDNDLSYDLDGRPRLNTPDMGAYQYVPR